MRDESGAGPTSEFELLECADGERSAEHPRYARRALTPDELQAANKAECAAQTTLRWYKLTPRASRPWRWWFVALGDLEMLAEVLAASADPRAADLRVKVVETMQ